MLIGIWLDLFCFPLIKEKQEIEGPGALGLKGRGGGVENRWHLETKTILFSEQRLYILLPGKDEWVVKEFGEFPSYLGGSK